MSNYEQACKHARNHRKDKYYQQCGFSFDSYTPSTAKVAEETAMSYHVRNIKTEQIASEDFSSTDLAVDFINRIKDGNWYGVFTDKGLCLMR